MILRSRIVQKRIQNGNSKYKTFHWSHIFNNTLTAIYIMYIYYISDLFDTPTFEIHEQLISLKQNLDKEIAFKEHNHNLIAIWNKLFGSLSGIAQQDF